MKKLFSLCLVLALLPGGCTIEYAPPVDRPNATVTNGETLNVHYLDVGQADCALIECGGEYMLIDGGNVEDGRMIVSYLLRQGVDELNTVIATHPHEDHLGGIPSVLAVFPTHTILSPTTTYSSDIFDDFLRYADQQSVSIQIPSPGDTYYLGDASITVLGPVKSYAETNDTSLVVRIEFGDTSFLFTGDMELTAENDMLDHWGTSWASADVLKVGHHGSETSTGYRFLYSVDPTYAVISVGDGNSYGHPHELPLSRLYDAGCTVFRTDKLGTIVAVSDGSEISFTWENQRAEPDNAESGETHAETYIGNRNSKFFHAGDCDYLPNEKNRVYFRSYEDAVEAGYQTCGGCLS